ncbi:Uncharacterised protein [Providencia rustigianii]|nr:Uncharacterised protein [Providencia rustigianii]
MLNLRRISTRKKTTSRMAATLPERNDTANAESRGTLFSTNPTE